MCSNSVAHLFILNPNTRNVSQVSGPDLWRATLGWKMVPILSASFCKIQFMHAGCWSTCHTHLALSAGAESTRFVYSGVILMWSALFYS